VPIKAKGNNQAEYFQVSREMPTNTAWKMSAPKKAKIKKPDIKARIWFLSKG